MDVRRATIRNITSLLPLFDAYRRFYGQQTDSRQASLFLRSRLKNRDSVVFVAWEGTESCGFLLLYPSFSSVSMKRLWILNDLFVSPSARRRGVAKALLERAIRHARETKSKGLILETGIDNIPAQSLYESMGWKKECEFHRYYFNL